MTLRNMLIDMNSFFASAEQQRRGSLRYRPVGVIPVDTEATCCIAASYEAKALGVKTGTPVWEAKELCPHIRLVLAEPQYYVKVHHKIKNAIESCLHVDEVLSIDEMSCRLLGSEREPDNAVELARKVKRAIAKHAGAFITCSIGLAANRLLAKFASNLDKPDGLVVLRTEDLPGRLSGLRLKDLCGIASGLDVRLKRCGILTVPDLFAADKSTLREAWGGVVGEQWWEWLRGEDIPVAPKKPPRSINHSHVLPPELRNAQGVRAVFIRLICKAATRLRMADCWARWMQIGMSTRRDDHWAVKTCLGWCMDTPTLIEAFEPMWRVRPGWTPANVHVILYDLVPSQCAPLPLFVEERHRVLLSRSVDDLNNRYGANKIYFAGMHDARDAAQQKVAFNHVPSFETVV